MGSLMDIENTLNCWGFIIVVDVIIIIIIVVVVIIVIVVIVVVVVIIIIYLNVRICVLDIGLFNKQF